MNTSTILSQIDAQIAKLQEAKTVLLALSDSPATPAPAKRGRPKGSGKKASLTSKRGPGRPNGSGKKAAAVTVKAKRSMSPEGKARIVAAQKERWAKTKRMQ